MAQYFTDFSEYTTDAHPSDWTRRWRAHETVFRVRDVVGATGGKVLENDLTGATSDYRAISWDDVSSVADVEIVFKARRTDGDQPEVRGIVRGGGVDDGSGTGSEDDEGYYGGIRNNGDLRIEKGASSSFTILETEAYAALQNDWHWVRFQATGTTVRVRAWADGASEPGTWNLSTTDADLTSGWVGVFGWQGGLVMEYDVFGVGTAGDPAPTSEPSAEITPTPPFTSVTVTG